MDDERPSADNARADAAKKVALAFLASLVSCDPDAVRATLSPDAVLVLPRPAYAGTTIQGADNLAEAIAELGRQYESPQPSLGAVVASDHQVIAEWRLQATIAATGQPYDQHYCWAFDLVDGRITEIREYLDTKYGLSVMGETARPTLRSHASAGAERHG
ncbi:nuclear transport factor 2 family protein [Streptomyces sp. NPDC055400]